MCARACVCVRLRVATCVLKGGKKNAARYVLLSLTPEAVCTGSTTKVCSGGGGRGLQRSGRGPAAKVCLSGEVTFGPRWRRYRTVPYSIIVVPWSVPRRARGAEGDEGRRGYGTYNGRTTEVSEGRILGCQWLPLFVTVPLRCQTGSDQGCPDVCPSRNSGRGCCEAAVTCGGCGGWLGGRRVWSGGGVTTGSGAILQSLQPGAQRVVVAVGSGLKA